MAIVFGDNQNQPGTAGPDTHQSFGNNNTLNGAGGDDILRGENGSNTTFHGDDGNDFMRGQIGDTFDGGADIDDALINLESASGPITANLQAMGGAGVTFGGVTVMNTEKAGIKLSAFNDVISTGDDALLSIYGADGADLLLGGANTDKLAGGLAADSIHGGDGADQLWGFGPLGFADYISMNFSDFDDGSAGDRLYGEAGDDILVSSMGNDTLNGGADTDTASYENVDDNGATDGVTIKLGKAVQHTGGAGDDRYVSIENVYGSGNADVLYGDDGDNVLNGNRGDDAIRGGLGGDTLTGGNGADLFIYKSAFESGGSTIDLITDMTFADRLDLHLIDAKDSKAGNQAFEVVAAFTGHEGELVRTFDGTLTIVELDTNGDMLADGYITMTGDVPDDYFIL